MIRRFALFVVVLLIPYTTASAQTALKVFVTSDGNQDTKEVGQLLRGKIGSTLRYSLTESVVGADLGMEVICLPVGMAAANGRTATVACSSPTLYFSIKNYSLPYSLLGVILIGDRQYVAEHLFDNLVEDTSPDKLQEMDDVLAQKVVDIFGDGYSAGITAEKNRQQKASANPKKN
jgi:hypothetical protein